VDESGPFGRAGLAQADGADLPIAALHQFPEGGAGQARDGIGVSRLWKANPEREECHPVCRVEDRDRGGRELMPRPGVGGIIGVVECLCHAGTVPLASRFVLCLPLDSQNT